MTQGPTATFINLPDHMEKQADEHLRVTHRKPAKLPLLQNLPVPWLVFSRNIYNFYVLYVNI